MFPVPYHSKQYIIPLSHLFCRWRINSFSQPNESYKYCKYKSQKTPKSTGNLDGMEILRKQRWTTCSVPVWCTAVHHSLHEHILKYTYNGFITGSAFENKPMIYAKFCVSARFPDVISTFVEKKMKKLYVGNIYQAFHCNYTVHVTLHRTLQ